MAPASRAPEAQRRGTPRLLQLVEDALGAVPLDDVLADLAAVARHDRYQASDGIVAAAEAVAAAASRIGLSQVAIERFPADGVTHFWSFRSATSWTPRRARFVVMTASGGRLVFDHAEQPFLVATYSAALGPDPWRGPLVLRRDGLSAAADAFVLVPRDDYAQGDWLPDLTRAGARGFITDGPCCVDPSRGEFSGRVELDPDTRLCGFSVTHAQFQALEALAAQSARIEVELDIGCDAPMPVVTALLPGGDACQREIWLTAHLCHPRPGANDNASGVAALLGAAATLRRLDEAKPPAWHRRRPIRLVWAPEYVGTAALLEARLAACGPAAWPEAVVNLDMVGGDQSECGGSFVVERPPDTLASPLAAVAEHVVDLTFAATPRGEDGWRPVSFLGYSDHALFAGPAPHCAAVQLTHWPDRFNHSAADTLDKVSPLQMRRSVAAAAVIAALAADDFAWLADEWDAVLERWLARDLAHAQAVCEQAPPGWARGLTAHVQAHHDRMRALPPAAVAASAPHDAQAWRAAWTGPANVRAMLARLEPARRHEVQQEIRRDKRALAYLGNLAVRADGSRSLERLREEASWAMRWPLGDGLARKLLGAWVDSGMFVPTR